MNMRVISSRPYLIRAMYEWLLDSYLTPHILVDTDDQDVEVPEQYIENGQIVLNIEPNAIAHLDMGNEALQFNARFSGVAYTLYIPVRCVKAIYAVENNRGMSFEDDDDIGGDGNNAAPPPPAGRNKAPHAPNKPKIPRGRPHLKVVK